MKVNRHPKYSFVQVIEIPRWEIRRVDLAKCREPRETLNSFYGRNKPDVVVNGGFFNMSTGETVMNYINEGKPVAESPYFREGLGIEDDDWLGVGTVESRPWRDFVSGYPVLVKRGEAAQITDAQEINYNARRTMVGFDEDTLYLVLVEKPGLAFKAMQSVMLGLGCQWAVNLDGGGSTKGLVNGESVTKDAGNRAVDNVLAVYLRRYLFRVQVGAFTQKPRADAYRDRIRALEDPLRAGYKDAFVRPVVSGERVLYKVQVGAYSTWENAVRVKEDLEKKGFPGFVRTEERKETP